jgi:CubicO group peptidase (beta-lactamase class C family)
MKFNFTLFILLIFSIWVTESCVPPPRKSRFEKAILESRRLIDSLQQKQKIPGIDVAVSIDGKTVWSEGFGFADVEHNVPVVPGKTRFRIGSVAKPFTAAALGKLMDNGKLNLNSPVQAYVPYFPLKKYPITVKQVGAHVAGIRHYRGKEFLNKDYYNSVQSSLSIFEKDTLLFVPGNQYSYSSYAYNLLSAVIEGASGEAFLPFIQREVFAALAMNSTCPDKNDSIIANRTAFYEVNSSSVLRNAPYVDNSYKWGSGGFLSTTADLVKFGEAHLSPGFLSAATLKELTAQVLNNGESTGYGLGWEVINEPNQLQGFGHSGGSVGGITQFVIYPKEKTIIVLLSNASNIDYADVPDRIVQAFLGAKKGNEE